ncbi:MAG: hypothetical protein JSS02_34340 [Planctomycetes bacterium]|nr:hypothetical protein [Planctomycetota bacterium]
MLGLVISPVPPTTVSVESQKLRDQHLVVPDIGELFAGGDAARQPDGKSGNSVLSAEPELRYPAVMPKFTELRMKCLAVGLVLLLIGPHMGRDVSHQSTQVAAATFTREGDAPPDDDDLREEVTAQPVQKLAVDFRKQLLGSGEEISRLLTNEYELWLEHKLDDLAQGCGVSTDSLRKIQLAGRGDIKRRIERIDLEQKPFENIAGDQATFEQRAALDAAVIRLRPIVGSNPFQPGSLFDKVVTQELTADQFATFQSLTHVRTLGGQIRYVLRQGGLWKEVRLENQRIDPADLAVVCSLKHLRLFVSDMLHVPDSDLASLSQASQLEVLDLSRAKLGRSGLNCLADLPNLQVLVLKNASFPEEGLESLVHLTRLQGLELQGTTVSDRSLVSIKPLERLESLNLSRTRVTDAGLAALPLSRFTRLTDLALSQTKLGDPGFQQIAQCRSLKRLTLIGTPLDDTALRHLAQLQELKQLIIDSTDITDAGLHVLSQLEHLEVLEIGNTRISDTGLLSLTNLKRLRSLNVANTRITDDGLSEFARAVPDVVVLRK